MAYIVSISLLIAALLYLFFLFLFSLNPFSGTKNSEKIFATLVSKVFEEGEIEYTLLKTG